MEVTFIRHLPVPGNEKRQYIGRTDEALSVRAVQRFRNVFQPAGLLNSVYPPAEWVIASPLRRCVQTAELIYPGSGIRTDPLLRECDFGLFEGRTYDELKTDPAYQRWLDSGGTTAFPGGETQEGFRERCRKSVRQWIRILFKYKAQNVSFVVHGGTIMAVLSALAADRREFYDWQTKNGCGFRGKADPREWENGTEVLRDLRPVGREIF